MTSRTHTYTQRSIVGSTSITHIGWVCIHIIKSVPCLGHCFMGGAEVVRCVYRFKEKTQTGHKIQTPWTDLKKKKKKSTKMNSITEKNNTIIEK